MTLNSGKGARLKPQVRPSLYKVDLLETMAATGSISAAGKKKGRSYRCAWLLVALLWAPYGASAELRIAVAANFTHTLQQLVDQYQSLYPEFSASISSASSGKHFAQIRQGAPFDVFFSADDQRTADLVETGDALESSRFVYARGQLMLWSADSRLIPADGLALLRSGEFNRLAIANPRVAPYGAAAQVLMDRAGVELRPGQLVTGQSIGQAFNFVSSGNAQLGLVAAAQVIVYERQNPAGSGWLPPVDTYPPIVQEAVLLKTGVGHPWAEAFLAWVACAPAAHTIVRDDGYLIPQRIQKSAPESERPDACTGN